MLELAIRFIMEMVMGGKGNGSPKTFVFHYRAILSALAILFILGIAIGQAFSKACNNYVGVPAKLNTLDNEFKAFKEETEDSLRTTEQHLSKLDAFLPMIDSRLGRMESVLMSGNRR